MKTEIKISDVPSEYRMLVLEYRGMIKAAIFFMERFFTELSFDSSRSMNDSIQKVDGAQKMIGRLYNVQGFVLPDFVVKDQETFAKYKKQISF